MVGVTPSKIAMVFLKVNVILFAITLGASAIGVFPYYLHVNQISNNIALDVANKNYVTKDELTPYLDHFTKSVGESGAVTYSLMTFKETDINARIHNRRSISNIKNLISYDEALAFSDPLTVGRYDYSVTSGGRPIASVSIHPLEGQTSKSLIVGDSSFDPLNKNADIVRGMKGESSLGNNALLVQRGTPFKVVVKTRYKLTGGVFGFMLHSALPVQAETVGVTTKYYQYEN